MCTHARTPFLTPAPHPFAQNGQRRRATAPRRRAPISARRATALAESPAQPSSTPHRAPSKLRFTPRQLPGPPISTRSLPVPRNTAAAVVNPAGRPPAAELPAPPRPDSNQPPLQLTRGPVHLPGRSSPSLPHRSTAARCSRRRRSLSAAADPAPAIPVDHNTHPQVELGELSPLGAIPAADEPSPRRETGRRRLLCPQLQPGTPVRLVLGFQGVL